MKCGTRLLRSKCHGVRQPENDRAFGSVGPQNLVEDGLQQQNAKGVQHAHQRRQHDARQPFQRVGQPITQQAQKASSCGSARLARSAPGALLQRGAEVHHSIVSAPDTPRLKVAPASRPAVLAASSPPASEGVVAPASRPAVLAASSPPAPEGVVAPGSCPAVLAASSPPAPEGAGAFRPLNADPSLKGPSGPETN